MMLGATLTATLGPLPAEPYDSYPRAGIENPAGEPVSHPVLP
jgi:hypothetical protein